MVTTYAFPWPSSMPHLPALGCPSLRNGGTSKKAAPRCSDQNASCFNCPVKCSLNKMKLQALFVNLSGRSLPAWLLGLEKWFLTGPSLGVSSSLAVKFHSLWGQRCGVGMPWASPTWMLLRSKRPGIPKRYVSCKKRRSGLLPMEPLRPWNGCTKRKEKTNRNEKYGHGVKETNEIWRVGTQANMMLVRSYLWPVRHVNMDLRGQAIQQSRPAGLWGLWVSKRPSWFGELLHWLGIICTGKNLPKIGGCSPLRDRTKNAVIAAEHPWPRHDEEPFLH